MNVSIPTDIAKKHELRATALARRAALTAAQKKDYSSAFARYFLNAVKVGNKTIAGYFAHRHELDVMPLLALLASGERICCLPVTSPPAKQLFFRRWHTDTTMVPGTFGIHVPAPESEIVIPEIIIVPIVAFDASRHRIGYGAGYYDFTLHALRKQGHKPLVIGAGYSVQQVEHIPAEDHDEPLDMIITEKGVLGKDFT